MASSGTEFTQKEFFHRGLLINFENTKKNRSLDPIDQFTDWCLIGAKSAKRYADIELIQSKNHGEILDFDLNREGSFSSLRGSKEVL